jgi:S-adenosylmethionine:tRNA ribosyltransferase-isomerase
MTIEKALNNLGTVPIPPYFYREAEESDKDSYNTVYATAKGNSVAAPTAGLHFTETVMETIGRENMSFLSLDIGAGTFKPVSTVDARNHTMHRESFSVSVQELRRIIKALEVDKKPIVSIGTTSCRTLETLHWCGIKKMKGKITDIKNMSLDQFEWIPLNVGDSKFISPISSFKALVEGLDDADTLSGTTCLMIIPGRYEFQVIDHLVTNFHAPDSTLMLLVSAFLGSSEKVKSVYNSAEKRGYRFLYYGDVCFFTLPKSSGKQV